MSFILKIKDTIDDVVFIGSKEKILEIIMDDFRVFSENKLQRINFEVIKKSEKEIKNFLDLKQVDLDDQGESEKIVKKKKSQKFRDYGFGAIIKKEIEKRNKAEAVSIAQISILTKLDKKRIQKPLERMLALKIIFRLRKAYSNEYLYYGSDSESEIITHEMPEAEKVSLGRKSDPEGTTIVILNYVNNLSFDNALTLTKIAKNLNLTKDQVSEPLRRLSESGRITRTVNKNDKHHYCKAAVRLGTVDCKARGREIDTKECNPNKDHPDCKGCECL